jgi:hypothetical protein
MATKISRISWANIYERLKPYMDSDYALPSDAEVKANIAIMASDPDLLPALMQFVGQQIRPSLGSNGLYSFAKTYESLWEKPITWDGTDNTSQVNFDQLAGIFAFLKVTPRGTLLPPKVAQSSPSGINYSAFVPLILASWKKHAGINYSNWDWSESEDDKAVFLDAWTLDYSRYFHDQAAWNKWQETDLTLFRDRAMFTDSKGTYKTPEGTALITKQPNAAFKELPKLYQFALLQLWIASPTLYSRYTITNPLNLDDPQEPRFGQSDTASAVFVDDKKPTVKRLKKF